MKKYQLMAPGPTPVPPNVLLAMAQPMIHHRTPEYDVLFAEIRAGLKRLFQTAQEVIPFASSGTGAMEAALANTLSAGDEAIVLRAGKFGERWEEIARAYGVGVVRVNPQRSMSPTNADSVRNASHLASIGNQIRWTSRTVYACSSHSNARSRCPRPAYMRANA